jgi:hypothetical protein
MADLNFRLEKFEADRLTKNRISSAEIESINIMGKRGNRKIYLNQVGSLRRPASITFLPKLDSLESTADQLRRRNDAAKVARVAGRFANYYMLIVKVTVIYNSFGCYRDIQRKGLSEPPKGFRESLAEKERLRKLQDEDDDDD